MGITKNYTYVHIDDVRIGDTVVHQEKEMTVGKNDIKYCSFMGVSIFGDSYMSGHKLVEKIVWGK